MTLRTRVERGKNLKSIIRILVLAAAILFPLATANAQDVVVQRHVTVREQPNRRADIVDYPQIGEAMRLLDEGARRNGYYHVQLSDGRIGWVYYTFVRQVAEGQAFLSSDTANIHFIDVDQGNAALLEFPCGAVLIDAGGRTPADVDHLIAYLEAFFARRADLNRRLAAVFVTHTHIDHNRGLRRVAETFGVSGYVHNGILTGSGRANANWIVNNAAARSISLQPIDDSAFVTAGSRAVTSSVIDPLACTRVDPRIDILSGSYRDNPGWADGEFDNGNNHSLVIRVTYGQAKFLFTGDLEEPAIETLLHRMTGTDLLDVDLYVVGHHGSANGTTPALVAAMTPQIALFSMGDRSVQTQWTAWAYGHPRRTIVTMIDEVVEKRRPTTVTVPVGDRAKRFSNYSLRDALYGTGWDGNVRVTARPDASFDVETSQ